MCNKGPANLQELTASSITRATETKGDMKQSCPAPEAPTPEGQALRMFHS